MNRQIELPVTLGIKSYNDILSPMSGRPKTATKKKPNAVFNSIMKPYVFNEDSGKSGGVKLSSHSHDNVNDRIGVKDFFLSNSRLRLDDEVMFSSDDENFEEENLFNSDSELQGEIQLLNSVHHDHKKITSKKVMKKNLQPLSSKTNQLARKCNEDVDYKVSKKKSSSNNKDGGNSEQMDCIISLAEQVLVLQQQNKKSSKKKLLSNIIPKQAKKLTSSIMGEKEEEIDGIDLKSFNESKDIIFKEMEYIQIRQHGTKAESVNKMNTLTHQHQEVRASPKEVIDEKVFYTTGEMQKEDRESRFAVLAQTEQLRERLRTQYTLHRHQQKQQHLLCPAISFEQPKSPTKLSSSSSNGSASSSNSDISDTAQQIAKLQKNLHQNDNPMLYIDSPMKSIISNNNMATTTPSLSLSWLKAEEKEMVLRIQPTIEKPPAATTIPVIVKNRPHSKNDMHNKNELNESFSLLELINCEANKDGDVFKDNVLGYGTPMREQKPKFMLPGTKQMMNQSLPDFHFNKNHDMRNRHNNYFSPRLAHTDRQHHPDSNNLMLPTLSTPPMRNPRVIRAPFRQKLLGSSCPSLHKNNNLVKCSTSNDDKHCHSMGSIHLTTCHSSLSNMNNSYRRRTGRNCNNSLTERTSFEHSLRMKFDPNNIKEKHAQQNKNQQPRSSHSSFDELTLADLYQHNLNGFSARDTLGHGSESNCDDSHKGNYGNHSFDHQFRQQQRQNHDSVESHDNMDRSLRTIDEDTFSHHQRKYSF